MRSCYRCSFSAHVCFSISMVLGTCWRTWPVVLLNVCFFPFLDEMLEVFCWSRGVSSFVFHVHLGVMSVLAWSCQWRQPSPATWVPRSDHTSMRCSLRLGMRWSSPVGMNPPKLGWSSEVALMCAGGPAARPAYNLLLPIGQAHINGYSSLARETSLPPTQNAYHSSPQTWFSHAPKSALWPWAIVLALP